MFASQFVFPLALQRDKVEFFGRHPFNRPAIRFLYELVRQGSQFVIATHSPLLMAYPDADGIHRVGYEDTEHFRVMRDFMADPHKALESVLD